VATSSDDNITAIRNTDMMRICIFGCNAILLSNMTVPIRPHSICACQGPFRKGRRRLNEDKSKTETRKPGHKHLIPPKHQKHKEENAERLNTTSKITVIM
jgi:calcineurin-like phosphoesterase family protein